jgi:hypothetical protein
VGRGRSVLIWMILLMLVVAIASYILHRAPS